MSTTAVEQILRIVAVLYPHGPQYPGKPLKSNKGKRTRRMKLALRSKRFIPVRGEKGDVIGYSRAACGASQSQTRVTKLGGFTPLDTAGQIGMADLDEDERWMLEWIAGDERRLPLLQLELAVTLVAQAKFAGWNLKAGEPDKVAVLALQLLIEADACTDCNTTGVGIDETGKMGTCKTCKGVGHVALSDAQIAKALKIPRETYRRRVSHAVVWAQALLQGRAWTILGKIRPDG